MPDEQRERVAWRCDRDAAEPLPRAGEVTLRVGARRLDVLLLAVGEAIDVADRTEHLAGLGRSRSLARHAAQVRATDMTHREVGLVGDRRLPEVEHVVAEAEQRVDRRVVALDRRGVGSRDGRTAAVVVGAHVRGS